MRKKEIALVSGIEKSINISVTSVVQLIIVGLLKHPHKNRFSHPVIVNLKERGRPARKAKCGRDARAPWLALL